MPFFHPLFSPIFSFLSFLFSQPLSLCLSRASIVQKRIIYFQDEGSLTIRLCEKGNDSCPSSPSPPRWLVFSSLIAQYGVIISCSIFYHFVRLLKQNSSQSITLWLKRTWSQQRQWRKLWGKWTKDLVELKYSFELCHTPVFMLPVNHREKCQITF